MTAECFRAESEGHVFQLMMVNASESSCIWEETGGTHG